MKVLFFTYDFPYPTNTGGKNRAYNLLKYSGTDITYYLFSFTREHISQERINSLKKIGVSNIFLFDRNVPRVSDVITSMKGAVTHIDSVFPLLNPTSSLPKKLYFQQKILDQLIAVVNKEKIDIVHCESFYTCYYLNDLLKKQGVKQIFGSENIEYLLYEDYIKYSTSKILRPIYNYELKKIKQDEEQLMSKADVVVAVTESEAAYIKDTVGSEAYIIPNGVNTSSLSFKKRKKNSIKKLLFVGNFSYFANIDAMEAFYKEVFIDLQVENIKLVIVGKNAEKLSFYNDKRIQFVSYIENIADIYNECDILISPIRIGGGTNFKILESMACGLPVIAYADRVKGLNLKDKVHALLAQNPYEFKEYIIYLIKNPVIGEEIAKNARVLIEGNYSWDIIGKRLNQLWHNL